MSDPENEEWAEQLVQAAAFQHVICSSSCAGATFASSGQARCTACNWELAARADASPIARARFALYTLACFAMAVPAIAIEEAQN